MTTIAKCANCDSAFKVKDHLVGKAVRCPRCGEAFRVEASERSSSTAVYSTAVAAADPSFESKVAEPVIGGVPSSSNGEGFFDTHDDVDAIYTANVATAKQRKRRRQLTVLIASGSLAAILLVVGTVVAFQYAYDNTAVPLELANPRSIDTAKLDGSWRPFSDTHWGYTLRMPGEPEIRTTDQDQVRALTLRDRQFGMMKVEFRKESHPEWSDYFAKLNRDEILQGVPASNVMKISSETTYRTETVSIHRYILVSKDSRLTKNVAVVHKFSVDEKTITAIWAGQREMLRLPEVLYFFSSIEVSGDRYITH